MLHRVMQREWRNRFRWRESEKCTQSCERAITRRLLHQNVMAHVARLELRANDVDLRSGADFVANACGVGDHRGELRDVLVRRNLIAR